MDMSTEMRAAALVCGSALAMSLSGAATAAVVMRLAHALAGHRALGALLLGWPLAVGTAGSDSCGTAASCRRLQAATTSLSARTGRPTDCIWPA